MADAKKRTLVLCVDRDNDLGEKAKANGPLIGRAANLDAAIRLALADPEDTDANTVFEAVKLFDLLSKKGPVQVATLTGHRSLGYRADKEISKQLERVLSEFHADSCVFVSDGADDESILPLVSSRMKIDSIRRVVMRQSKELEKTYFLLIEKLKDPYYARILIGIPALLLVAFALSDALGFGWRPVALAIGAYLLAKGFGFEENILASFSEFKFSVENIGFVAYLASVPLFLISFWLGLQAFTSSSMAGLEAAKIWAYTLRSMLLLFPWAVLLVLAGRVLDLFREGKRFEVIRYATYAVGVVLLWLLGAVAADWVLADKYFSDFVSAILISVVLAFVSVEALKWLRARVAANLRLENKEAMNEIGTYLGKVVGIDRRKGFLVVQTSLGQRLSYPLESISEIGDRVIVKSK